MSPIDPIEASQSEIGCHKDTVSNQHRNTDDETSLEISGLEQLALKLLKEGKPDDAEKIYRRLVIDGSKSPAVFANFAAIYRLRGMTSEAIKLLGKAILLNPRDPLINYNLGNALMDDGQAIEAIEAYSKALLLQPNFPEALFNLGNAQLKQTNYEQAIAAYNKSLCLKPRFPEALLNLGNALKEQNLLDSAVDAYRKALTIQPDNPQVLFKLGVALKEKGMVDEAISLFEKTVLLKPDTLDALAYLGKLYRKQGKNEIAISCYEKAIVLNPGFAHAHFGLGTVYMAMGEVDNAITSFERAMSLKNNFVEAHMNHSLALFMIGEYHEAWPEYEWRWAVTKSTFFQNLHAQWNPSDRGKNLLITGEQGIGDQIMFCSMLNDVLGHVSSLTVTVDKRLLPLMERSFRSSISPRPTFLDKSISKSQIEFDAWIPMGSLGKHFRNSIEDFLNAKHCYLSADHNQATLVHKQFGNKRQIICGISWKSLNPSNGASKSIPLDALAKAVARDGIRLVTLQYGDVAGEVREVVENLGIDILELDDINKTNDLDGLAALTTACDLVISTSNTTAHMAGALGKNTWVLLQKIPDCRWGIKGETSHWYPSVRLFRQTKSGYWGDVLEAVSEELSKLSLSEDGAFWRGSDSH